jgi:hypothetical protein
VRRSAPVRAQLTTRPPPLGARPARLRRLALAAVALALAAAAGEAAAGVDPLALATPRADQGASSADPLATTDAPPAPRPGPEAAAAPPRRMVEIRRFPASEARQGVAVDARHFYAIDDRRIGKYDRRTGERVASWAAPPGAGFRHLNGCCALEGRLHCAHSNFPEVPPQSSIELFDARSLEHVGSHSFGIFQGSATWIDRRDGVFWVAFANYAERGRVPGRGPAWSSIVLFDPSWRPIGGYAFPAEVVARFGSHGSSGGAFGSDGLLYATGHDAPELWVLRVPKAGPALELVEILPAPLAGQGVAWDPEEPAVLWSIRRDSREVVASRLATP